MRVLAIETATPLASAAAVDEDGVLAESVLRAPMYHLEWLLPAVEAMLGYLALSPDAIEGVAVSCGPGGFTGLRIGIATAAAMRASLGDRARAGGPHLHPRAAVVGLFALPHLLRGDRVEPAALRPLYGRRPVAWPRQETMGGGGNPQ